MTRPEDIPERVWALAGRFCGQYEFNTLDERALVAHTILAAEKRVRDECARIALPTVVPPEWMESSDWPVRLAEMQRIAAAIRKGGEHA